MQYVFIAEGIGITPFRSMIKYTLDKDITETITLFHIVKSENGLLFKDIFAQAEKKGYLEVVQLINKPFDKTVLQTHIRDLTIPLFYISGPQSKVEKYREILTDLGVDLSNIKTDLFTGYDTA